MSLFVRTRVVIFSIFAIAFAMALALTLPASSPEGQTISSQASSLGLERAHAHNDYEHTRPLFDALDHGFKSVEADIWLVDGELIIAHDPEDVPQAVQEGRTLESLYLEPLRQTVDQNGGSVYPGDPDYFTLLIDIKSDAVPTYRALHEELEDYQGMLTKFGPRGVRDGAITAIVSGNRPRELRKGSVSATQPTTVASAIWGSPPSRPLYRSSATTGRGTSLGRETARCLPKSARSSGA